MPSEIVGTVTRGPSSWIGRSGPCLKADETSVLLLLTSQDDGRDSVFRVWFPRDNVDLVQVEVQ